jgi:hypothetical protein
MNEIKSWTGEMMADTGDIRLAINEEIKLQLGLKNGMKKKVSMTNGTSEELVLVGGI